MLISELFTKRMKNTFQILSYKLVMYDVMGWMMNIR